MKLPPEVRERWNELYGGLVCGKCNGKIRDPNENCPHCGAPKRDFRKKHTEPEG